MKKRRTKKIIRPRSRRLFYPGRDSFALHAEVLEDRRMFASFADNAPTLNLSLLTGDQVSIISTGSSYVLSLASSHIWTGTNDANVIGNGTSTLTITDAGIGSFTTGIAISDNGSGGGDSVFFGNSLSSGYANNFTVTLANSTSGASTPGLAFVGESLFTGGSALKADVSGDIIVNPNASVSSAEGAIDLAATGPSAPLTADGNVLSNGGSIVLQATGAVTVGPGVTVNSGTATLTLAADVTESGSGNDGVGTLSIEAGATVLSSNPSANAITLRGADVDIDTSSNPAVIGASRQLGTTPSATYSVANPGAMAFDEGGNLYATSGDSVLEFAPGSTTASATYSADTASALAFDSSGNLYVGLYRVNGESALKFPPDSTTATATYSAGYTQSLVADSSGNLYVANESNGTVSEFAPGSTTASTIYSGLSDPDAMALGSNGNLYVANHGSGGVEVVDEFTPGNPTSTATYTVGTYLYALAFDALGNMYVTSFSNGVEEFAPGSTTPSARYSTGLSTPVALAIDSSGNLFVANKGNNTVSEFAPGQAMPIATLSAGLSQPDALAFDSYGDLYVANGGNNTVSEFSPASTTPVAGGVVIQSSVESRPLLIGGTNSSPVAGINLTSAELAQIFTTSTGRVTIGDANQTGNITFSTATPATTAGAMLEVIQSVTGPGQIILDDGAGAGTGLNGNGGTVVLSPGIGGLSTTLYSTGTPLATDGFMAIGTLDLSLGYAPSVDDTLILINNTAAPAASNPINGTFSNLAQGATVNLSYGGTSYEFQADDSGGDGNDLTLHYLAKATLIATDLGGTYDGSADPASESINGGLSLEGITPTLSYYSGAAASGSALAGAPSHAGTYTAVASFAGSTDYAAEQSSPATFVISPAPLTITANDQTMAWGDPLPTLTASYSGFVGNDSAGSLTTLPSLTTTATSTSPITTLYPITVSGAVDFDYAISYVAGQLTITSAVPPSSSVDPLSYRTSDTSILVSWSGTPGTGGPIQSYAITVTGTPLIGSGSQTSYTYNTSQTPPEASTTTIPFQDGYVYDLSSQATDAAQNPEPARTTPDTTVTVMALPWQNPSNPLAVLGGNSVVPADALAIIDYLNLHPGNSSLPATAPEGADYYDVLGENSVVPADALAVIDYLNLHPAVTGIASPDVNDTVTTQFAIASRIESSTADQAINPLAAGLVAMNSAAGTATSDVDSSVSPAVTAIISLSASERIVAFVTQVDSASSSSTQPATPRSSTVPGDSTRELPAQWVRYSLFADQSTSWWGE